MALWGKVDQAADKPKYLNTADTAAVEGISAAEAQTPTNKARGVQHAGWVLHKTYTDAQGKTRRKTETLVAMGTITGDDNTDDTTIGVDPVITIGTQPANVSVTAPATATFSVVASITNGAALSYQWQIQQEGAGAWADISGATSASYTTGATATGDGAGATDGDKYRVVVSATGAASVTSSEATLTVA